MRKFLAVAVIAVALTGCASQAPTETPVMASKTVEAPAHVELAPATVIPSPTAPVEAAPVDQAPMDTITAPTPVYVTPVATPAYVAPVQPVAVPVAPVETAKPVAVATEPVCMEDEPCWDCKTMENKICGPVTVPAPPAPVVPSIPPYTDSLPIIPPHAEPNPETDPEKLAGCSEFELRAEDGTCVPNNYWDDAPKK